LVLETKRLVLRPWRESDAENLYKYAKDPLVGPIAGWPPHKSVEQSLEIIKEVFMAEHIFAITLRGEDEAIGCIGLMFSEYSNMNLTEKEAEIGYWIGSPFWGKGIMTEAVNEIVRYSIEDLTLTALWCGYFDGNNRSKRVQEKCGFIYHSTRENILVPLMNVNRTEHVTRLTKEDWEKIDN